MNTAMLRVACNEYPLLTFARRAGREAANLDENLALVASVGFAGYESAIRSVAHMQEVVDAASRHQVALHSIYVNTVLHDAAAVQESIDTVEAIAEVARAAGTAIVVTNPSPIRWGSGEDKDDRQLATQAAALNRLGERLRGMGMTLAYHNHDVELRQAAREFHHMMIATDPAHVSLCLDAHWIYRGAGNSQIALFDIVELYGARTVELHLRQSQDGVWSEAFGPGDIDYGRLAARLREVGVQPHLVLEQAVEAASPHTLDAVAAHAAGLAYTRQVFGD